MTNNAQQVTNPLHIENTVNSLAKEDLKLPQAFTTYRSMLNDETIGAGMSLIKSLINKRDFSIEVPPQATSREVKLIASLNKSLNDLDGLTKPQLMSYILSQLEYGHSMLEQVMVRKQGTHVFRTFSPIHPINVQKYVYKRNILEKLELNTPDNDGLLIQQAGDAKSIKGEKVLMFKLNADLDNPLGTSMLNRCYIPWKKKTIAAEYELIGVAKNLSGVLKIKAPAEYINAYYNEPTSENARYMEELFEQAELIHGGKSSFAVVASDVTDGGQSLFDIDTLGNKAGNDLDTNVIIGRLEASILTTLFTDILTLGQSGGGSFALADSKTSLLALVIDSICNGIAATFKQAVKTAYELNAITPTKDYPTLKFEPIEALDFETFSRGFQRLVKDGVIEADAKLEEWVRERINAPKKDEATVRTLPTTSGSDTDNNERDEKEA